MLEPITSQEKAAALADLTAHIPSLGPDTSYAAVGMIREPLARLEALLSSPEAQGPAVGGPFYNALRLVAAAATAGMAEITGGKMRLS